MRIQIAVLINDANVYAEAAISWGNSKQPSMGDVPSTVKVQDIAQMNGKAVLLQFAQAL